MALHAARWVQVGGRAKLALGWNVKTVESRNRWERSGQKLCSLACASLRPDLNRFSRERDLAVAFDVFHSTVAVCGRPLKSEGYEGLK